MGKTVLERRIWVENSGTFWREKQNCVIYVQKTARVEDTTDFNIRKFKSVRQHDKIQNLVALKTYRQQVYTK